MAEQNRSVAAVMSDEYILAEIAAKHVKKLARVIDEVGVCSSNRSGVSKLPGKDLGKEMLTQQMVEKSRIDDLIKK